MSQEDKRFVIQEHTTGPDVHWDLMLESDGVLRKESLGLQTYRLDKSPLQLTQNPSGAVKIFDHPMKFLTYEGPVNKGRGSVRIADYGTYEILHQAQDRIELALTGRILNGRFTLTRIDDENWQFGPDTINSEQT